MVVAISGQHRYPARAIHPDPEEIRPSEERLGRDRLGEYLRACLRWLNADPAAALAAIEGYWPPPRPRGNPSHRCVHHRSAASPGGPGE